MPDPVDYVPFETTTMPAPGEPSGAELERLYDVPVELAVEIGRTQMTIRETLALGPGSIVTLDRLAGEPVDLLVNGKPIARGEVVVLDEEFGLRVTEVLVSAGQPAAAAEETPASTPASPPVPQPAASPPRHGA
ncbi:MAG: flagellar motor switch protein FliN [Solirubrobacteraceae bacterium]